MQSIESSTTSRMTIGEWGISRSVYLARQGVGTLWVSFGTPDRGRCVTRDRMAGTGGASVQEKAKTGILGLDDVLVGGLSRGNIFLLEGSPGAGKTTAALQFLMAGARVGEQSLYITLSETAD